MDIEREKGARPHSLRKTLVTCTVAAVMVLLVTTASASASNSHSTKPSGHGPAIGSDHGMKFHFPGHNPKPPSGTVGAPVATGLNAPFGISVDLFGRVYVAESGIGDDQNPAPGQVSRFTHGTGKVLATDAPFLTDVDASWFGTFDYTVGAPTNVLVRDTLFGGTQRIDIGAYEAANNPDQINTYGPKIDIESLVGSACWSSLSPDLQQVASQYTGVVDSDAFRTIQLPDGSRAVSDAAGNDILRVARNGSVSLLAVLPPNVVHVDKATLSGPLTEDGQTFPACVLDELPDAGIDYAFEPVPTGMAIGHDGNLYVGMLPGGEIPGAAKVVQLDLHTKQVKDFATGFSDVTDIAFGRFDTLYVTELFNGDIQQIPTKWSWHGLTAGTPSVLASVPLPNGLAVDWKGTVYASINSLTPVGQVVPISP